MHWLSSQIQAS